MESLTNSSPSNEYHNNDQVRLRTLFTISKQLLTFKNVEESFAEIISCAAECFPLESVVLIEHWEKKPRIAVWFSEGTSKDTVARAVANAKLNYSYLSGASAVECSNFLEELALESEFLRTDKSLNTNESAANKYIVIPLMVDNLPPLGALQFEGANHLDEKDLEFVNALANLVSVALDRFYKTKLERSQSATRVNDLEYERVLREDFVSLLSHDLKSPITVIKGAAEIIEKQKDVPNQTFDKLLSMIIRQSNHVTMMINNLLDANKIRSGQKLALNLEKVSLNSLVEETVSELKIVHGDRFSVISDHSIVIFCDKTSIKRILENLSNNAVKYGSAHTPIKIILDEVKDSVLIKVHNSGKVISAADQVTIFQKFRRSTDAMVGSREGWGIGLTLVRGVAEAHGGSVEVESSLEGGTVFTVKLPKV